MDPPEMLDAQVATDKPDLKDPPAHPDPLVPLAMLALMARLVTLANWAPDPKDPLVPPVPPAKLALQVQLAKPANQAKTVAPVPLEAPATVVPQAPQARTVAPAALATLARTAHPAAANTAHQLVWLQVIKRPRFQYQAARSTPPWLGCFVDTDLSKDPRIAFRIFDF